MGTNFAETKDWLYRWEYAAADPDHDLGAIERCS